MRMKNAGDSGESKLNLTPMIDVVFLLIIFFMLVTQFSNLKITAGILLPDMTESRETESGERLIINVQFVNADKIYIWIDQRQYGEDELKKRLKAEARLKWNNGEQLSDLFVLVRCDFRVHYKHVQGLIMKLLKEKIWKMSFATIKDQT